MREKAGRAKERHRGKKKKKKENCSRSESHMASTGAQNQYHRKQNQWNGRLRPEGKKSHSRKKDKETKSNQRKDKCEGQRTESQYRGRLLNKRADKPVRNAERPECQRLMLTEDQKKPTDNSWPRDTLEWSYCISRINKKSQVLRANKQFIYKRGRKICLDSALSDPPHTRRQ